MTFLAFAGCALVAWVSIVAPYLDDRRKARRELDRVGRVTYPTRYRPINAVRRDPSPSPRKKTNA